MTNRVVDSSLSVGCSEARDGRHVQLSCSVHVIQPDHLPCSLLAAATLSTGLAWCSL